MSTPSSDLPPPPFAQGPAVASPTQVVGQQIAPSTAVPVGGGLAPVSGVGKTNQLAVISLVTAIVAPFGHLVGVGGITLIIVSLVTGHMARSQIRKTGEDGANLALAGLIISYVHLAFSVLLLILLFGVIVALVTAIFHAAASGG